jgi:hypothetical protein
VVGTDRPVRIDAAILNTGTTVLEPLSIELSVDGVPAARQEAAEMVPGAAETVRFDHQFDKPGPHIVMAKVLSEDEMPSDNSAVRVLDVVDKLPVLVVEGDPSPRPLDGAASFIEIALTPADEEPAAGAAAERRPSAPAARAAGSQGAAGPEDKLGRLVAMKTVAAPEIQSIPDLRSFKVIVLANVPKLPQATAAALKAFVQEGGGLLIVAGDKMIPDFYNRWMVDGGEPFAPAALAKRRSLGEKAARLGLKTFRHPALELLADTSQSDADRAGITSFWALDVDQRDQNVRTAALLDTGEPFLVERKVGKGVVLQTAVALDRKESNLPSLKCFVPLVHELTYYLAAPGLAHPNVRPGSEFVVALPFKNADVAKKASEKKQSPLVGELIEVITPSEQRLTAAAAGTPAGCRVTFAGTYEPGLYHLILPARAGDTYVVPPLAKRGLPFVVLNDAEESRLTALTDAEFEAAAKPLKEKDIDLFRAQTTSEMTAAVSGNVPGEEMWKYLAVALLGALLAEIGLTRWIAVQRRMHLVETVTFGPATVDVQTFRERARGLLAIPSHEPESVSKT